ncbi:MAG: conjugal transfer protein [Firmicutes bacterium]|nr:conjugal transfer protein [Bacillota bacterium]
MKNHSKVNNNKNEIELLLRKELRIKQKPSQELKDSIIRQYEKNIQVPAIKEPDTLDAEPMNL